MLPVGSDEFPAAEAFARSCRHAGLRVQVAVDGSLGARVRSAARRRVPYAAVVGAREAAEGRVALRLRDGRSLDPLPAATALELVRDVVAARSPALLP